MRTALTDMLGVDFPLVAFSHCRDVVAAVTNSGGFGMLGAVRFTPDQLDEELSWLDRETHGRPYGVDVLIPTRLAGRDEGLSADATAARVPAEHVEFARDLLLRYGVISNGDDFRLRPAAAVQYEEENVKALLDVAFAHPVRLVASALGIPSPELVARAKSSGVPIAALVGKVEHARRQAAAGVDLIVAQGHEAGGHAGEITTMVLTPQVADAVAPIPVLAAGGIADGRQIAAAIALGAAGVWTGSVWLMTEESETDATVREKFAAASSADTMRSRVRTGKLARQLRSSWHDEWESAGSPGALPMPLMEMISDSAFQKIGQAAAAGSPEAYSLQSYFVGQVVGMLGSVRPAAEVVCTMIESYIEAVARLNEISADN
jgi:NAD(P)H-dependent flavin oxidoreductase YrpB (nitropropane dioxygenase family)